jgi:hypothetical protein
MAFLNFLKGAEVTEVEVSASNAKKGGPRKQRNPNPALLAIRVWKDGSVFPSQALVDMFNLEYGNATVTFEEVPAKAAIYNEDGTIKTQGKDAYKKRITELIPPIGNAFDIIDTREWGQWKMPENNMLFIAAVPKDFPKVDMFGGTVYDDAGKPSSTVMEQGAATYGSSILVPAIKEIYGIDFDTREYVDMLVAAELEGVNINTQFSKPISLIPKRISRGKDIGQSDYVRRENLVLFGFVPMDILNEEVEVVEDATISVEA